MEWLLQHESDPDIDEPLPTKQTEPAKPQRRREFIPNRKVLVQLTFGTHDITLASKNFTYKNNISYVNCFNSICEMKISFVKLIFICESSIMKCMLRQPRFHV